MKALTVIAVVVSLLDLAPQVHADPAAGHGMLVFGDGVANGKVYLSHLPMFHKPHDYQVIVEADLGAQALAAYQSARKANPGESVYTLDPEAFVLPQMIAHPSPFKATLYQGHFERGGKPIAQIAQVKITRVIHFRKFDPMAHQPPKAEYLLFGAENQAFMAHFITARPDFDQILPALIQSQAMKLLYAGKPAILVTVQDSLDNIPLQAGAKATLVAPGKAPNAAPQASETLTVPPAIYLELDDLS